MDLDAFLDELEKIAKLHKGVELRPHQQNAVDFVVQNEGRGLLAHATGTGKTLSAIATVEKLREEGEANKTLVVAPASLRRNFTQQGVRKFTDRSVGPVGSGADYQVMSLEKFRKDPTGHLEESGADTLVVDEIHRAKDPGTKSYRAYREAAQKVDNMIGLTGSFISNHPKEVVPLMDIVAPGHSLGSQQGFTSVHTRKERISKGGFLKGDPTYRRTLHRKPQLHKKLEGKLHYVGHDELKDLPSLKVQDVHVPMTQQQTALYNFALGGLSRSQRAKIRQGLPVDQTEATYILPRLMKARQAANSIGTHVEMDPANAAEETPKLRRVMDDVEEHLKSTRDGQAIVYTNLVRGGANELFEGMKARGLKPGMYSGVNKDTRDKDVDDFRSGKKNVIVLTPAGGEGISLDNATFFAEVDRHYNPERNQQAIARGRRIGGQAHRAPKDRVLEVNRYHSDPAQSFFQRLLGAKDVGVDEWIGVVAKAKDILNEEMREVTRGKVK
jgi:superfamily II DNA or RNA helicase